jgi:plasmid stability protein
MHALHAIADEVAMASVLTIRKLPEDVQALLRQRAAASGRSVEAEARDILATACSPRRAADWWGGLAKRRLARTRKQLPIESAELIREGRNAR